MHHLLHNWHELCGTDNNCAVWWKTFSVVQNSIEQCYGQYSKEQERYLGPALFNNSYQPFKIPLEAGQVSRKKLPEELAEDVEERLIMLKELRRGQILVVQRSEQNP